ncbi:LysM peptidoglycan-binding domain-containing protein [Intrasporangium oryzae]|nr:LysM peptidoglycan-binding domain-containing protein [Intrasporangium oryzae]
MKLSSPTAPTTTAPPMGAPAATAWARPGGAVLRALVSCGLCLVVARVFAQVAVTGWPSGAARADDIVLALLAWVGMACALWLAVGTALVALGRVPGFVGSASAAVAARITPRLVKQALGMALGASVGTLALPAGAVAGPLPVAAPSATSPTLPDPGYHPTTEESAVPVGTVGFPGAGARLAPATTTTPPPVPPTRDPTTTASPDALPGPGWRPTRPAPVLDPERATLLAPAPRLQTATVEQITVRRGDTLWAIAARHLGPEATDAQVAREWPRWYAANAGVVGDDPDSIEPGTQLVAPEVLPR